ncbi:MAG: ArsA-related P-loop ATPase [Oligoflexia bacterium]|nr:ArsA-related P-loop ATPase [Oligoflexia bacterium]
MTQACQRNLIFVIGKGGVGKTVLSQALALALSQTQNKSGKSKKILWVCFEDPSRPMSKLIPRPEGKGQLWHLNLDPMDAFEEYASLKIEALGGTFLSRLKIGTTRLTKTFLDNKLIRYMAKAAPGIHELVLLGKVWYEREHYDHVVIDMPSTGYGVAMFQSTINFSKLFGGGPLARDADQMLATFRDPEKSGFWIVALPEEMPLREAIELDELLRELFPDNPAEFVVNRVFPESTHPNPEAPDQWETPFATDIKDYAAKRSTLEAHNLKLWDQAKIKYTEIGYIPPSQSRDEAELVRSLADEIREKGIVS